MNRKKILNITQIIIAILLIFSMICAGISNDYNQKSQTTYDIGLLIMGYLTNLKGNTLQLGDILSVASLVPSDVLSEKELKTLLEDYYIKYLGAEYNPSMGVFYFTEKSQESRKSSDYYSNIASWRLIISLLLNIFSLILLTSQKIPSKT